jgi:hypothetical protein
MAPTSFLTLLRVAVGVGEAQPPPPALSARSPVDVITNNDSSNDGEQPIADDFDAEKQAANSLRQRLVSLGGSRLHRPSGESTVAGLLLLSNLKNISC